MTFLAPALLVLGLSVAVPLALHLLQRQQGPRMVFPALRYLKRAEREHATRIRLRQVLLLALRILALLLVAAAAARPFLRGGGSGHEPTSVVLVLDNSLSSAAVVGDRRVLDGLKDAALETLGAAGADDRFWLIRAGTTWEPAIAGDAGTVSEAVRATRPMAGHGDLAAEVARATSILAGEPAGRAREIHLLSDLQATALRRADAAGEAPPLVVLAPGDEVPANRGIESVEVGGGLPPRAGERSTVTATVAASGGTDSDSVTARLVLDGAVRAAANVRPGAAVVFPFPAREAGVVTGRVELDADALADDDRRWFVATVAPPPSVALGAPLPFVREALDVLEEAGRIRSAAPGTAEVVVAPGAVGADAVRRGRGVVVFPPASVLEVAAANQRLAGAGIPWRYGTPTPGEARLDAEASDLADALRDTRLRQVYPLEPQGAVGDTVLLRLAGGEPWAVAGAAAGGGRYVLLGTPLTMEGGTIPTSAAMLPLLDRAVAGWAGGGADRAGHEPGDVVTLPAADSLVGPDGTIAPVAEGAIHRLTSPGIHRAVRGGETVGAYAVNPAAGESRLERAGASSLEGLFPGREVRVAGPADWGDAVYVERLGREIAWPLLLLALLALIAESFLAATGRGTVRARGTAAGPEAASPAGAAGAREAV